MQAEIKGISNVKIVLLTVHLHFYFAFVEHMLTLWHMLDYLRQNIIFFSLIGIDARALVEDDHYSVKHLRLLMYSEHLQSAQELLIIQCRLPCILT